MRKVIWCCAAAAVAAAVAAHWAADYASRHPQSFVGQCVVVSSQAVSYHPIFRAGTAVVDGTLGAAKGGMPMPQAVPQPAARGPAVPQTVEPSPFYKAEQSYSIEMVEPEEMPHIRLPGAIVIRESEEPDPNSRVGGVTGPVEVTVESKSLMPKSGLVGDSEECEPCPKVMPMCCEETEAPPAVMPYCKNCDGTKAEAAESFSFWQGFFHKAAAESGATEESEPYKPSEMPDCKEDPAYHHQYPGCPYNGACPYTGRCPPPEVPAKKEQPKSNDCCPDKMCPKTPMPKLESETGEITPVHPEVDTTEYRPSDAAPNEKIGHIPF